MNWAKLAEYFYKKGNGVRSFEGWLGEFLFREGEEWRKRFYSVMEKMAGCEASVILDLMCGGAYPSRYIAMSNSGKFVVGVDLDLDALVFAKKKIRMESLGNVELVRCDVKFLPFKDGAFDLAFEIGGIEFFMEADKQIFLREVSRVTKANLILTFTNEKFKRRLPYRLGLVHLRFLGRKMPRTFTKHEIEELLKPFSKNLEVAEAGYSIICRLDFEA